MVEPRPLRQSLHRTSIVQVAAFVITIDETQSQRAFGRVPTHRGEQVIRWSFTEDRCIQRSRPVIPQCPSLPPPGIADIVIQHMPELVDDRRLDKPMYQVHGPGQDEVVTQQAAMLEAHRQVFPHPLHPRQQAPMGIQIGFDGGNGRLKGIQFALGPIPRKRESIQFFHRITP